jgi:hypothetical protein
LIFYYLKTNWELTKRRIKVEDFGEKIYNWYTFFGVSWIDLDKNEERVFNIDKMHELEVWK